MIYIDGTTLDTLGRKSEYPIFLTLGNIPNLYRNLPDAKVLIGFLLQLLEIINCEIQKNLDRCNGI